MSRPSSQVCAWLSRLGRLGLPGDGDEVARPGHQGADSPRVRLGPLGQRRGGERCLEPVAAGHLDRPGIAGDGDVDDPFEQRRLGTEPLAARAAGFDYFAIGVPTKAGIEALARRLTALGEQHAGVHFATIGWVLPSAHDPDGHEIRFYTTEHHTAPHEEEIRQVDDAVATAAAREQAYLARRGEPGHSKSP